MTADNFKSVTENFCGKNFHGGVFKVGGNIMGFNAGCVYFFEEIDGHSEVNVANTFDGKTNGVFARIKNAVFAGAVIFEFEEIVSVFKCEYVFGFSAVNKFVFHNFVAP